MKAFINRVSGGVLKALSGLSYKVEVPGLRYSEAERGAQWLRVTVLSAISQHRRDVRDALLSISCFNRDGTKLYKHALMADEVLAALGQSIRLYADNGSTVVGVLVFKEPTVKTIASEKGVLTAVVDVQVYYEATS